jgi:hypothetical protein
MSAGIKVLHLCLAVLALALLSAQAQTANSTAVNCSRTAVLNAIDLASSGGQVAVPAGNCSWTEAVVLPRNKDLTIMGAGIDQTVLTCAEICFDASNEVTTRISGFTFQESVVKYEGPAVPGKSFRLDHNKFFSAVNWRRIEILGEAPARHPTGVVDHNQFHNYAVHVNGTNMSLSDGPQQHELWAQDPPLGIGVGIVYVENNTFFGTTHQNAVDGNYAGRFVFRFNTLSGITYIEIHSVQGANRAVQLWELYKNTFTKNEESWYPLAMVRGGTGVIFGNRTSANVTNDILMDNVRSCRDPGDGAGKCDGSSNWDQNTPGMNGYACRDQVGRGKDGTVWSPGLPYTQTLTPAYFWDNVKGASTPLSVFVQGAEGGECSIPNLDTEHLVADRDFYTEHPSFSGTTGMGTGTLAARPAACVPGVAYWATDQGEWNTNSPGPDGQLYKCTAPNTWSFHYRPYVFPHPLTLGSAGPSAPTNVRILVQ